MKLIIIIFTLIVSLIYYSGTILTKYNFDNKNPEVLKVPKELLEISGIAFNSSGRLFGHNDEESYIFEIDKTNGKIKKAFAFGSGVISGDFEDIEIVGDLFYVITGDGTLYEFKEGENKKYVNCKKYYTGLKESNDVEGMCYDDKTNSLLLACKDFAGKGYKGKRGIYSFNLKTKILDNKPRILLSVEQIKKSLKIKDFSPSGIVKHPKNKNFLIISAKENAIVEVEESGVIKEMKKLPNKIHSQPEGIAISSDNTLYISNEGGRSGTIIKYKMQN